MHYIMCMAYKGEGTKHTSITKITCNCNEGFLLAILYYDRAVL